MLPYLRERWHNPSSIYVEAQQARQAIDEARATVAASIGASPEELVFTSGGSESDSLALRGALTAGHARGRHLITTAVEHHAVLDTAEQLEREGAEVTILGVDAEGRVDPADVEGAVRDDTVLVSAMHANNEVGALNDVAEISRRVHAKNPRTLVHSDAVQSAAHLGVSVDRLGVDLLTLTAHKLYGPRGAGRALYALRHAARPPDPRRRAGARPPRRHREHAGDRRLRGGRPDRPGAARGRPRPRARAPAAPDRGAAATRADARGDGPARPRRASAGQRLGPRRLRRGRVDPAGARPRRDRPRPRAPPARPARSSRATCSSRWACRRSWRAARCA